MAIDWKKAEESAKKKSNQYKQDSEVKEENHIFNDRAIDWSKAEASAMRKSNQYKPEKTVAPSETSQADRIVTSQLIQKNSKKFGYEDAFKGTAPKTVSDVVPKPLLNTPSTNELYDQAYKYTLESNKRETEMRNKYANLDKATMTDIEIVAAGKEAEDYTKGLTGFVGRMGDSSVYAEHKKRVSIGNQARDRLKAQGYTQAEIDTWSDMARKKENIEFRENIESQSKELAEEHPVLGSAASVFLKAASAPASAVAIVDDVAQGGGIDTDDKLHSVNYSANKIRSTVSEDIAEDSKVGAWLYDVGMSGADSLVAGFMPGGMGALTLATNAAVDTTLDLTERGVGAEQALIGGIAAGAFEAIFEKWSIGEFKAMKEVSPLGVKDIIKNLAKSMGVNASEESLTELANILYDTVANGDSSNYQIMAKNLMANGMTEEQAKKEASKQMALQVLEAGVAGAVMGVGFSSVGSATGFVRNSSSAKALGSAIRQSGEADAIIAEGNAAPDWSRPYVAAQKAQNKLDKGKSADRALGVAAIENDKYIADNTHSPVGAFASAKTIDEVGEIYNEKKAVIESATMTKSERNKALKQLEREHNKSVDALYYTEAFKAPQMRAAGKAQSSPEAIVKAKMPTIGTDNQGNAVSVSKIEGIKDGNITVKTSEGVTQKLDINELNGKAKALYDYAASNFTDADTANLFVDSWDGTSIEEYKRAFDYYYKMGRTGMKIDDIRANDNIFGNYLSADAQMKIAKAGLYGREFRKGLTDLSVVRKDNRYKYESKVLQIIGEKNNLEIFVLDEDSKINGKYLEGTNRIVVYRNADGRLVLSTAGHESFHFIKNQATDETSKAEVKALENLVLDSLKENGMDVEARIRELSELTDDEGNRIYETREDCIEEIVADGMFDVFSNEKFAKKLLNENKSLFGKLANKVKEIIAEIKSAIAMLGNKNPVIGALKDDIDTLDKINTMFDELLTKAGEKYKSEHENGQKYNAAIGEVKNSFAMAREDKSDIITQAEKMEKNGATKEYIWKKLGLIRDASGIWVYEIDDSEMKIYPNGDARLRKEKGYKRMNELFGKIINGEQLEDSEKNEFSELQKKYNNLKRISVFLNDFVLHNELFKEYPELNGVSFEFDDLKSRNARGYYDHGIKAIVLDNSLKKQIEARQLDKTAIHEIQHLIQHIDGRAAGSSPEYWAKKNVKKLHEMQNSIVKMKAERAGLFANADNELRRRIREINNADWYSIVSDGKTEQDVLRDKLLEDDTTGIYKRSLDMDFEIQKLEAELEYLRSTSTAEDMYYNTAGEIEARETANRLRMTAEERTEKMPDLGWERAVFADGSAVGYDIGKTTDNKPVVIIKDDILYGVKSVDWIDTVKNTIKTKFSQGIPIKGKLIKVNRTTWREYTGSKDTQRLQRKNTVVYKDKLSASNNLYEIILASTNYVNEDLNHQRKDNIVEFARGDVLMQIGNNNYKAEVIVGLTKNNSMVLYDIVNFTNDSFVIKKEDAFTDQNVNKEVSRHYASSNTRISQNKSSVNNNFMRNMQNDTHSEKLSVKSSAAFHSIYSAKQTSSVQAHWAEAIRENHHFRNIMSLIDEMQLAEGKVQLSSKDIDRIAREILKTTSSRYDGAKLSDELTVLYDYMANVGKNADTEEIFSNLLNISNGILQQSEMKDSDLYEQYKDVRSLLREQRIYITPEVKKEIEHQFGDYQSFRNALMGKVMRLTTTDSSAPTLDEVWQELSEKAPEYFPKDFNEKDMPLQLAAFFEAIAPKVVNPYEHFEENIEDAAAEVATEIFQKYYEIERLKTPRQKYKNLVFENMQKLETHKKALRNEFKKKTADNEQKLFEEYRKRVTEYKQQRVNADRRRKLRNQLDRNYNYLNRRIIRETDNDHIPENLKSFVNAFRFIVPDRNGSFSKVRFTEFENEYRKLEESTALFDADIAERISALRERLTNGFDAPKMRDLDNFELEELRNISEHVKFIVQNENRLFSERLKGRIEDYAKAVHSELATKPESKVQGVPEYNAKAGDKMRNSVDSFIKGLTKPEYLFSSLGSDTLKTLYDELRRGENTEARIIFDAKKKEQDIKKKYDYDPKWNRENVTLELSSGKLTVTAEQVMALYATSKRKQGLEHMLGGGVLIYKNNETVSKNGKTKNNVLRKRVHFNESDIPKIGLALTTEQKLYVDAMVEYITKDIGEKRNEISMKLNGIEKYKESYYFPIKVDRHFVDTSIGRQEVVSTIKNQSSSKRTVDHAKNPIEISGFTENVNQHIYDSALYCAYVLPINDFKRVYNFRDTEFEGDGLESLIRKDVSVKEDIRRSNGVNAIKQIEDFMVALDSGSRYENLIPVSAKLAAKAKKVSVMANLSVVVQQPTAVFRAMLYVDPKYFATIANKADIEEMKKWNGCALKKEIGYFDVNMGRTATDYINEFSPDKSIKKNWTFKEKLQNGNAMLAIDQVAGWGASKADEMTWGAIWNACKKQVKAENGELTGDALNSAAAELFQTVISKTQVYDSVFTKPDYMRRKEGFAMLATQFMSEPLTSLNMLAEAVVNARKAKGSNQQKRAKKTCARAFACYMTSLVVNSALKSLVYTIRDDDEDESFLEKYVANVTESIATEPFGMVPYVKDILSILQGYDLSRTDVAVFASFKDAIDAIGSEKKGAYDKIMAVLKAAGQASGIPIYSVIRDGKAIYDIYDKIVNGVKNGFEPTTGRGVLNELKETFDWVPGVEPKTQTEQLYDAWAAGDKKHYNKVYNHLEKKYDDVNEQIRKLIKDKYDKGEIDKEDAEKALINLIGDDEDKVYWTLKKWESPTSEGESFSKYRDFYKAVESGNGLSGAIDELLNHGTKKSSISSAITSEFKAQYIELYKSNPTEAKTLQRKLLDAYEALGYDRDDKADDIADWLE